MDPYNYLAKFSKFGNEGGFKPGLERIKALLAVWKNPQEKLKTIHVTGSNGKGSTIAFLKKVYQEAGYKVGIFTSPSLNKLNEMIEINDQQIDSETLKRILEELSITINKITSQFGKPSFFEVLTTIAFIHFWQQEVDIVLLEVGLGGKSDATNVINEPLASVITNISLEHTSILGDKVEEIAREKAGIIKHRKPVITAEKSGAALNVIAGIAEEKSAKLVNINEKYKVHAYDYGINNISYKILNSEQYTAPFELGLLGLHQIENSLVALAVIEELNALFPVKKKNIYAGFKKAKWPGRLEIWSEKPLIVLDGAHNPSGIKLLINFLQSNILNGNKIIMIMGVLKDKDYPKMMQTLEFPEHELELIVTRNQNERRLEPEILKKVADEMLIKNQVKYTLEKAIKFAVSQYREGDVICITGSLFTVAEAKGILDNLHFQGINQKIES